MKISVPEQIISAVNHLKGTNFFSGDFNVFVHCEDTTSDYWGIWSWIHDKYYIVCKHGHDYSAYECKDRTHVKYMMMKMAL